MNITVFGATGRTGSAFIRAAIAAGHSITALVRDRQRAQNILPDSELLLIVEGDVLHADSVREVITPATEVVFSALSTDKQDVLSRSIDAIVLQIESATSAAFAAVSTAGILNARDEPGKYRFESSESKRKTTDAAKDHLAVFDRLQSSSIEWILFCPTYIPTGPAAGPVIYEIDMLPHGVRRITPESVAEFALQNLKNPLFVKHRIGIGEKSDD